MPKEIKLNVYNNTSVTREYIESLTVVGKIKNLWRMKDVTLYADPATMNAIASCLPIDNIFSIGLTFNGLSVSISKERPGRDELVSIGYWAHGQKVLVKE